MVSSTIISVVWSLVFVLITIGESVNICFKFGQYFLDFRFKNLKYCKFKKIMFVNLPEDSTMWGCSIDDVVAITCCTLSQLSDSFLPFFSLHISLSELLVSGIIQVLPSCMGDLFVQLESVSSGSVKYFFSSFFLWAIFVCF